MSLKLLLSSLPSFQSSATPSCLLYIGWPILDTSYTLTPINDALTGIVHITYDFKDIIAVACITIPSGGQLIFHCMEIYPITRALVDGHLLPLTL